MMQRFLSYVATQRTIGCPASNTFASKAAETACVINTIKDLTKRKTLEVKKENKNVRTPKRKLCHKLFKRLLITRLTYNDKRHTIRCTRYNSAHIGSALITNTLSWRTYTLLPRIEIDIPTWK
ncbi:hypothetical protein TETLIM2_000151 [Candidatus Hodgkinia cicadicola]|nr:hypothetical protein TETLIM2_000151 [Candidatus Hodgkinia cicadicola]